MPLAIASYAEGPTYQSQTEEKQLPTDLTDKLARLGGFDDGSLAVIGSFLHRGLPEGAFRNALEATQEAKDLPHEDQARYFVGTLKRLEENGQYGRRADS